MFLLLVIPEKPLNQLYVGLLRYEQHLEQTSKTRSSLSRTSSSLSSFARHDDIGHFKQGHLCRTYTRRPGQR